MLASRHNLHYRFSVSITDSIQIDGTGQCPRGFVMNEDDHCRPDKKCPKGFKEHANDETGTCFPTKDLLRGGGTGTKRVIIHNNINNQLQFTVPTGYNAAFTMRTHHIAGML